MVNKDKEGFIKNRAILKKRKIDVELKRKQLNETKGKQRIECGNNEAINTAKHMMRFVENLFNAYKIVFIEGLRDLTPRAKIFTSLVT